MKKVAIFTNNLMGGGAERVVSYLLNEGSQKFEFQLILLRNEISYQIPLDQIKIYELEGLKSNRFTSLFRMRSLSKKLQVYLEANKIETVLSLLNRCNLIACNTKKAGWKGKLIISERADTLAYYRSLRFGWVMLRLVKKYYPYADVVTVISKGIAKSLEQLGIRNSLVIYNPAYPMSSNNVRLEDHPFTFINVARLWPQKNQALLLKAFARIPDKKSRLVILGIGELEEPLKKLAESLNIRDRVSFEGFKENVHGYLQQSDCFVFSSNYEGLGNVVLEALQANLPVISTDCPSGPREILAPDTPVGIYMKKGIEYAKYGILTPVESEEDLANAMQNIIVDRSLRERYRLAASERVRDFDLKKTMTAYFELF